MLNVITKKYIIKHTFGNDEALHMSRDAFIDRYMHTIYPYPECIRPVAMYWGRIQADEYDNHPGYIKEADVWDDNVGGGESPDWKTSNVIVNKPRPGILLEEDVYYFIWDRVSWIVPKDIYDKLDDNHILVGDFSKEVFDKKMSTNARVAEITVNECKETNIYDIINDEEQLKKMSEAIDTLMNKDLKVGQDGFTEPPRYAIMAIMDEMLYKFPFVDVYNDDDEFDIYEAIGLPMNDDCYELPNYIVLGFKNIMWEMLCDHGYANYGTSLDYAWLEDKGLNALAALRWEALSANDNGNLIYAFDGKIEDYNKDDDYKEE